MFRFPHQLHHRQQLHAPALRHVASRKRRKGMSGFAECVEELTAHQEPELRSVEFGAAEARRGFRQGNGWIGGVEQCGADRLE